MTLQIQVNGENFEKFISATVEMDLTSLSRSYSFTAATTRDNPLPVKVGDSCEITIDEETVLTGFIEKIDISYSSTSHVLNVSGRDRLGDLIDSSLESPDFQGEITLEQVIRQILDDLNMTDITVVNQVEGLTPFKNEVDLLSPEIGQGAWDFIEPLARKKNVLIHSDASGNLIIDRSPVGTGQGSNNTTLANRVDGQTNNILSASASFDGTQSFNKYAFHSQYNIIASRDVVLTTEQSVRNRAEVIVDTVRNTRQCVKQAEESSVNDDLEQRVKWEANFKQAQERLYSATIQGFRDNSGVLWAFNQIVRVDDQFAGINADMLIKSVVFSFSLQSGQITTLNLVPPDSYLPVPQPPAQETTSNVGEDFFTS